MKKVIREYYNIYRIYFFLSNKLDNLEEIDKSLGTHNIPILKQEKVYNLKR